jgi:hypothetical protein
MQLSGFEEGRLYCFLSIHVLIASWIALDKSPFLPPNFSTVFNLSCFSKSSEMSTFMRPNFNHLFLLVTSTPKRQKQLKTSLSENAIAPKNVTHQKNRTKAIIFSRKLLSLHLPQVPQVFSTLFLYDLSQINFFKQLKIPALLAVTALER